MLISFDLEPWNGHKSTFNITIEVKKKDCYNGIALFIVIKMFLNAMI